MSEKKREVLLQLIAEIEAHKKKLVEFAMNAEPQAEYALLKDIRADNETLRKLYAELG